MGIIAKKSGRKEVTAKESVWDPMRNIKKADVAKPKKASASTKGDAIKLA